MPRLSILTSLALILFCSAAAAQVQSKDQQKCINDMNKAGGKLASTTAKLASKCLKDYGNAKNASAEGCLANDESNKIGKASAKVAVTSDKSCTTEYPTIAEHSDAATGVAAVQAAATAAPQALLHDIIGPTLDTGLACDGLKAECKCRDQAVKGAVGLLKQTGKVFEKCKKLMLSTKEPLATGAESDANIVACITGSDSPDTLGYSVTEAYDSEVMGKPFSKLFHKLEATCPDLGLDPFDGDGDIDDLVADDTPCAGFAGPTGSAYWAGLAVCLRDRVRCRWCEMTVAMDNLTLDCDVFDDELDNASCARQDCAQPVDPANGTYASCDPTTSGGTCTLTCDNASQPSGDGENDCFDGAWQDDQTCEPVRYVFVSAGTFTGAAGRSAADALCQAEADASTYDGSKLQGRSWVAWLSTDAESAESRIDEAEFRLPTGVVIAGSKADLLDGSIAVPIDVLADGTGGVSEGVTTGTLSGGTSSGNHCSNWTTNLGTTTIGGTQYSSSLWTNVVAGASCATARRVYCFEQ